MSLVDETLHYRQQLREINPSKPSGKKIRVHEVLALHHHEEDIAEVEEAHIVQLQALQLHQHSKSQKLQQMLNQ
mgnify:CR=1 FL=1